MLIFDLADPQELVGFTRGVQQEQDANRFILSQFLPNQNIDDIEWRATTGQLRDEDATTVRAWDAESPIGGRQGVRRLFGELPPISRKYRLGEEERLRMRALDRGGDLGQIVDAIFNDAAKGARSVAARIELFRGEALWKARLDINENGVVQTVDFGRDDDLTVGAAVAWSDHTVAALTEELAWRETYLDINGGVGPEVALISDEALTHVLLNEQYRGLAAYAGITPAFLNIEQVNQVRVAGAHQRVIPAEQLVYLPPSSEALGATFTGITAEALELQQASQIQQSEVSGMVAVVEKSFDPGATWTKTAAVALPVLMNPDLTMSAEIL